MQAPSQRQSSPLLTDAIAPEALRPWPFPALTPQQQLERQAMEVAIADDALRALPSCFGALS